MLAAWLKKHYQIVWWFLFCLSIVPALLLLIDYRNKALGINPLETLIRTTGKWSLIFLLITLAMTPLRRSLTKFARYMHSGYGKRLSDWNWIVQLRRMLGLYCAFYALLHLAIFLHLDIDWDWHNFLKETGEKPYIFAGVSAFILLLPLVITSTNAMMRRMGKNWRRLHRLTYLILIVGLLHFWWQMKAGVFTPWPYTLAAIVLLGYRIIAHYGWFVARPVDDGMEVPERDQKPA